MDRTREELEDEVLKQWQALGRAFKATTDPCWMELDLTLAQLRTLLVLAEEGPLVIGQIAHRLGVGLSTGGHLVDRLVQAGLAMRAEDSGDRRRTMARLTSKGEDLYMRLLNRTQHLQSLLQRMREDELIVLLQSLQAMQRVIEEDNREKYAMRAKFEQKTLSNS
ncbi:MAG TPA: MarR family transcriptional regulator [Ktedonobacteraceae bacterium]|nr:MarR family transcriptional regulator [Ktedonobacteraceae bacterium]